MTRYVALLRGITPSGKNMTNAHLRGLFEQLGFAEVASVQASGNILFTAAEDDAAVLEDAIDAGLATTLGLKSTAILRTAEQMASLAATDPFGDLVHAKGTYLTATFVKDVDAVRAAPGAAGAARHERRRFRPHPRRPVGGDRQHRARPDQRLHDVDGEGLRPRDHHAQLADRPAVGRAAG